MTHAGRAGFPVRNTEIVRTAEAGTGTCYPKPRLIASRFTSG